VSNYDEIIFVEEAEDSKDVTATLNTNFIKTSCILQMLKINLRDMLNVRDNLQSPKYFLLNFPGLIGIEVTEIVLVKNQFSFFVHRSKI
jgi:hypothetical protein